MLAPLPPLGAARAVHHTHGACRGSGAPGPHPEPRKDYKPEHVLTAADLDGDEDLIALFDSVREHSTIVDGIRCHCGCADGEGMYSLLSCYEGNNAMKAMSKWCPICRGQGRLTVRLVKQGKSLAQIREAIDVRY
jgi:hypothetical protein